MRVVDVFPAGGPVDPALMVGREAETRELSQMVTEGISVALSGPRRIGKTTLGDAVSAAASAHMVVIPRIEIPEARADAAELLTAIVDGCERHMKGDEARSIARALKPTFERLLKERLGLDISLDEALCQPEQLSQRGVLLLPVAIAEATAAPVLLFLDELQRVSAHEDGGAAFLADLIDIYSGSPRVAVLADGSDERLLEELYAKAQLGKLFRLRPVGPTIPYSVWRDALPDRFGRLDLRISEEALEEILAFGAERPFPTMLVCQHAANNARLLGSQEVSILDVDAAKLATEQELGR
jgi:hypothetical protein